MGVHALVDDRVVDLGSANLTELEILAEHSGINMADGHARQALTAGQRRIVEDMPGLFSAAQRLSPRVLDRDAQAAFLTALGQHSALACAELLTCYSSSVAMEILARAAYAGGVRRVGLVHPTFDNIPDILRGVGMQLVPVAEDQLTAPDPAAEAGFELLFVTTPNNPTGAVLNEQQLARWAAWCAARDVVLVLDTSFRGFDSRAMFDHYAVLDDSGARWAIIEDTGKLFPVLDLKAGFLAAATHVGLPLRRIYTDILLGVSPFILRLVVALAEDGAGGGLAELHQRMAAHRAILRATVATRQQISYPDPDSRISVDRLLLPAGLDAVTVTGALQDRGVRVLPCPKFHWAVPEQGNRFLRVALGRPEPAIRAGAAVVRDYLDDWCGQQAGAGRGQAPGGPARSAQSGQAPS